MSHKVLHSISEKSFDFIKNMNFEIIFILGSLTFSANFMKISGSVL